MPEPTTAPTPKAKKAAKPTVAALATWVAEEVKLFGEESPFRATIAKGAPKLVVVTGENASGKSLFVRVIAARAQRPHKLLPVSVSIRERTGGGTHEMGGLRRAMMFGEEGEQSTGATSVGVVKTAFGNLDRDGGSILVLDEPEMGLAEAYARAMGEFIGQSAKTIPAKCRGIVIVSHSRPLVQGLIDGYGKTPTHAAISPAEDEREAGVPQWLATPEHHSVEELLALRDTGLARWRAVNKLLGD